MSFIFIGFYANWLSAGIHMRNVLNGRIGPNDKHRTKPISLGGIQFVLLFFFFIFNLMEHKWKLLFAIKFDAMLWNARFGSESPRLAN